MASRKVSKNADQFKAQLYCSRCGEYLTDRTEHTNEICIGVLAVRVKRLEATIEQMKVRMGTMWSELI